MANLFDGHCLVSLCSSRTHPDFEFFDSKNFVKDQYLFAKLSTVQTMGIQREEFWIAYQFIAVLACQPYLLNRK